MTTRQTVLTTFGVLMAGVALTAFYYVFNPIEIRGMGEFGHWALMLAPQLSVFAVLAALFGWFTYRCHAKMATVAFGLAAVLFAIMALLSTIAIMQRAKQYGVTVSFGSMLLPHLSGGAPRSHETVTYGTTADGLLLVLDVWPSSGQSDGSLHSAIVKIHGGGWGEGSRGELVAWNQWFNNLGYDVFDIDYRLPPPVRWKDEVGDVKCALGWVVANSSKYHIDSRRISVMGYSAGGNLALLAAYSIADRQLPPSCPAQATEVCSVINIYGPTDMTPLYSTTGSPSYLQPKIVSYIGGPPSEFADRYNTVSPVSHVSAQSPPTIIVQGEADRVVPVEQASLLHTALTAVGVYHETYYLPWTDHGFDVIWNSAATQITRKKIEEFLELRKCDSPRLRLH